MGLSSADLTDWCEASKPADICSLTNRVFEHPPGYHDPVAAAPSPREVKKKQIHNTGIHRSHNMPSSSSSTSHGSSQSAILTPPSAAMLQATPATHETRHSLDNTLQTLQYIAVLQLNVVLQNSQAPTTVPGSIAPICETNAEACQCQFSLDKATKSASEQESQPEGGGEACKQVAGFKTAFMQSPDAAQALLFKDLQDRRLRQHNDFQLGTEPPAFRAPGCCQMTTTALEPMQPDAPTCTTSHLGSLSNPALAVPYDHSIVGASHAAGTLQHKQAQSGNAVVQQLAFDHQPEAALQESVPAHHCFSRPGDASSLLPGQSSTPDAQLSASEPRASASSSSTASIAGKQHTRQMTDILCSSSESCS